jgi:hypothetical protein
MVPHDNDILCGRGNNANRHAGNVFFRDLIAANKVQYATLTKKEKMLLARQIVTIVCHHTDPPGRFLGRDTVTGLWYDIGWPRSLEKTSQALREKSAATKAAERNGNTHDSSVVASLGTAPSLDEEAGDGGLGNDAESEIGVEVTVSDPLDGESPAVAAANANNALCRASTAKTANHNRQNLVAAPPTVVIPKHLHQVYTQCRKSAPADDDNVAHTVPLESSPLETTTTSPRRYAALPPPLCAQVHHHSYSSQQQYRLAGSPAAAATGTVSHSSPHYPSPSHSATLAHQQLQQHSHHHRPYDYRPPHSAAVKYQGRNHRIESHHHHPFPTLAPPPSPMTLSSPASSPPRRSLPAFPTTTENQSPHLPALVTPPSGLHDCRPLRLHHDQSKGAATTFPSFPQRNDKAAAAPAFPLDVFMNPHYSFRSEAREPDLPRTVLGESSFLGNAAVTHERSLDGTLSPTREQQPKRQRTKEGLLNTSIESVVDVNTSGESSHGDADGCGLEQSGLLPTSGLTEAIATQLTLEDRVIRSPSEFTQSLVGGRRRRSPLPAQPRPRPVKTSAALDMSADSMDGLAALSTAAFLRLDESF